MALAQSSIEKLRQDHVYMIQLINRIKGMCPQRGVVASCADCSLGKQSVCRGNVEQLIRNFVEVTLKHNLLEGLYMEQGAPAEHRIAHNQAHLDIAEQLQHIRAVFSDDGNSLVAIEGIDQVLAALKTHETQFDAPLEEYLRMA